MSVRLLKLDLATIVFLPPLIVGLIWLAATREYVKNQQYHVSVPSGESPPRAVPRKELRDRDIRFTGWPISHRAVDPRGGIIFRESNMFRMLLNASILTVAAVSIWMTVKCIFGRIGRTKTSTNMR